MQKRVYIAGPDVFSLEWPKRAKRAQSVCDALGLLAELPIPAEPLTGAGVTSLGSRELAQQIFESCIASITRSDAIVANLTPFRGVEPDSGTLIECAIAYAMKKPVIGYAPYSTDLNEELEAQTDSNGYKICFSDECIIEQFGLPFNLMVAGVCTEFVIGDIATALERMRFVLDNEVAHRIKDKKLTKVSQ